MTLLLALVLWCALSFAVAGGLVVVALVGRWRRSRAWDAALRRLSGPDWPDARRYQLDENGRPIVPFRLR